MLVEDYGHCRALPRGWWQFEAPEPLLKEPRPLFADRRDFELERLAELGIDPGELIAEALGGG